MRVVDTSAWIEGLIRGAAGNPLVREIPAQSDWIVPTIVQLELAKWLSRNASAEEANGIIAFTNLCVVIELDTAIAIRAAGLCRAHGLATADAIIYATALHADADLLTCDAHFEGLEKVVYLPKGG